MNTHKVKVAIADDHAMVRFGLRKMLDAMENIEVVIEASNGKELVDSLSLKEPELAIIDINMPVMNGEEAIRQARKMLPDLKVIILSMNNDERYFKAMNDLGVDGYIIKESEYEELEHAIATVLKGGKYFSQELLLGMVTNRPSETKIDLTEREREVLNYLCKGYSVKEIGEKLFISPRTVEKHRSDLFLRTQTTSSISLVVYAIKNGIVKV
ncbi:MAG TPA: response regulator transcription factor [Bacteroidales bacterium]|nr:response regulator transcription factor [Bacteroidales bacterium]